MKAPILTLIGLALFVACGQSNPNNPDGRYGESLPGPITLVIHGGAGAIEKDKMSDEAEKAYMDALNTALQRGFKVLDRGGSSCEAVMASIQFMEDSPLFNAGKGAVLTAAGTTELDASIMDGKTGNAGAVAGVKNIKSPIEAAYLVMTESPHVMLSGEGAEAFAVSKGVDTVGADYFMTERRRKQLEKIRQKKEYGTVGAVALDQDGNICAATSTGGMSNKMYGRIGDAPIIGAGTYASNQTCGVSSTGWGEYYIRNVAAYDVAAKIEYQGLFPVEASQETLDKIEAMGGNGGMIVLDKFGNVAMPFNTSGMYRGYIQKGQEAQVKIFRD